jgi:hypothetical protein
MSSAPSLSLEIGIPIFASLFRAFTAEPAGAHPMSPAWFRWISGNGGSSRVAFRRTEAWRWACFAAVAVYAGSVVRLASRNSHFLDDDLLHFLQVPDTPLWAYLLTPIDLHFAPLHRLLTFVICRAAPLDFDLALAVLVGFHLAAAIYLFHVLRLLVDDGTGDVLFVIYGVNVYLFAAMVWWSAGAHRFPYILAIAACTFHYLRFRSGRSRLHWALVMIFMTFGLGFYEKAVLIPAYLLAIEFCLRRRASGRFALGNFIGIFTASLPTLCAFVLARHFLHAEQQGLQFDLGRLLDVQVIAFTRTSQGLLTLLGPQSSSLRLVNAAFWLALFGWSALSRPRTAIAWFCAAAWISMNFTALALSERAVRFGPVAANPPRYYFELMFPLVVFAALVIREFATGATTCRRSGPGLGGFRKPLIASILVLYACLSYAQAASWVDERYAMHRRQKEFIDNFTAGAEALRSAGITRIDIVDLRVPRFIVGGFTGPVRYEEFAGLLGLEVARPAARRFRVSETGEILPLKP